MKAILSIIISGALVVSGYAQTRNVLVGTNNAVVQPTNFWSADASNARAGLGLGTAATNPVTAFQSSSSVLSNLASSNAINLTNLRATNINGTLAVVQGGTGATNAGGARTNLGIGSTNIVEFGEIDFGDAIVNDRGVSYGTNKVIGFEEWLLWDSSNNIQLEFGGTRVKFWSPIEFATNTDANITRTNLGLGWSALTNTNAGTGLVSVNTNGEVVSPANFWQVSPANTRVQLIQPVATSTNTATNARNLYLYSLAISTTGVTNTIQLPTNGGTLLGDVATVIHEGPTSSVTAVRQIGSGTNIISINQFQDAIKFIYEAGGWRLADNLSFVEPIYFSGTNAAANAAASRTNLGLGKTNNVEFDSVSINELRWENGLIFDLETGTFQFPINVNNSTNKTITRQNLGLGATWLTNTNVTNFRTAIGLGETNSPQFQSLKITNNAAFIDVTSYGMIGYSAEVDLEEKDLTAGSGYDWNFGGSGIVAAGTIDFVNSTNAAITRTNLGLGATNAVTFASLTNNGDITINQTTATNGLLFIRRTNNEAFLGMANLIASNNTTVSNETLFRVGVAEATNRSAQFGFRSTNTNGNGVAVFSVFGYNALMMVGPSDPAAGTNPIQATISSINPTNRVMTLITTNTGAMQMHRPIEWDNTTNSAVTRTNIGLPLAALTNTTTASFQRAVFQTNTTPAAGANLGDAKAWLEISVVTNNVTNSYRIPVFQ